LRHLAVWFLDETGQSECAAAIGQWNALPDIAIAGLRAIRRNAKGHGKPRLCQRDSLDNGIPEHGSIQNHVIRRHHHQYGIVTLALRPECSQRQRRCRIATKGFKQGFTLFAKQAHLLGHDEAMVLIANQQRFAEPGNAIQTSHGCLQHRLLADQRQKLFRIFFSG